MVSERDDRPVTEAADVAGTASSAQQAKSRGGIFGKLKRWCSKFRERRQRTPMASQATARHRGMAAASAAASGTRARPLAASTRVSLTTGERQLSYEADSEESPALPPALEQCEFISSNAFQVVDALMVLQLESMPSKRKLICAICTDGCLPGDLVTKLPCGHMYHFGCIAKTFFTYSAMLTTAELSGTIPFSLRRGQYQQQNVVTTPGHHVMSCPLCRSEVTVESIKAMRDELFAGTRLATPTVEPTAVLSPIPASVSRNNDENGIMTASTSNRVRSGGHSSQQQGQQQHPKTVKKSGNASSGRMITSNVYTSEGNGRLAILL